MKKKAKEKKTGKKIVPEEPKRMPVEDGVGRRGDEVTSGRDDEVTSGRGDEVTSGRDDEVTSGRDEEATSGRGDEKPFDFGGIPDRDLKKNLGCG